MHFAHRFRIRVVTHADMILRLFGYGLVYDAQLQSLQTHPVAEQIHQVRLLDTQVIAFELPVAAVVVQAG